MAVVLSHVRLLLAAGPSYFFLIKSNQKSRQQKYFPCRTCLCPAKQAEPQGRTLVPRYRTRKSTLQHQANALSRPQAKLFCLFSPESCFAAGIRNAPVYYFKNFSKAAFNASPRRFWAMILPCGSIKKFWGTAPTA